MIIIYAIIGILGAALLLRLIKSMPIASALMGLLLLAGSGAVAPSFQPDFRVAMTAYNAVPGQTDDTPNITASGAFSNPEIIAARSRDLAEELPFGTVIAIDGPASAQNSCGFDTVESLIGYRVIADTMNARFTNRVDVLFDTKSKYLLGDGAVKNAARVLGVCEGVAIRVVGKVDMTKVSKLPKTQAELASLVKRGDVLAVK